MPFHLRGMLLTDERGRYEIETIIPGAYPIPPGMPGLEKYGGLTRARHIHISVMPFLNVPLTTQLYFKDDPNRPGDPLKQSLSGNTTITTHSYSPRREGQLSLPPPYDLALRLRGDA